jgi:hypothetical protein
LDNLDWDGNQMVIWSRKYEVFFDVCLANLEGLNNRRALGTKKRPVKQQFTKWRLNLSSPKQIKWGRNSSNVDIHDDLQYCDTN